MRSKEEILEHLLVAKEAITSRIIQIQKGQCPFADSPFALTNFHVCSSLFLLSFSTSFTGHTIHNGLERRWRHSDLKFSRKFTTFLGDNTNFRKIKPTLSKTDFEKWQIEEVLWRNNSREKYYLRFERNTYLIISFALIQSKVSFDSMPKNRK